ILAVRKQGHRFAFGDSSQPFNGSHKLRNLIGGFPDEFTHSNCEGFIHRSFAFGGGEQNKAPGAWAGVRGRCSAVGIKMPVHMSWVVKLLGTFYMHYCYLSI